MIFKTIILSLSFLSLVSAVAIPVAAPTKRSTVCNGHAELCSRQYSNVTYVGSHDSFAFSKNVLALSRDQEVDIPTQLALGVRLLQAQSHRKGKDVHFCHTSCILFDGGKVVDYLKKVKEFLDKNPNEVLTLLFTNPEKISVKKEWKPLFDQAGITPLAYVPPQVPMKQSEWPTLGEMIESGKRVVVFFDKIPDNEANAVDFILPEFQMIWETPFSVTDPKFPCKVDRMSGPLKIDDHMHMINHSLNKNILGIVMSDPGSAKTTNSVKSILDHVNGCSPLGGNRAPAFILLDWVNKGEVFKAANILNGVA